MIVKPIRNEKDLNRALARIDGIIDAAKGTAKYDELEVITTIVEFYEARRHPIDPPDSVEPIRFRMAQQGLRSRDLAAFMGGKSRVSEVLPLRRPLSLTMIRNLHRSLHIPYESLIENC
jgi:HTH-type transcriptional regulator/antitoxin HigA